MKVVDYINASDKTIISFRIIPPLKGKGIEDICEGIDPLMEFQPPFINVTYHREEYDYKKMGNGLLKKVSVRKRPGTVGICAALMNRYKVDAIPHIICGGFTKEETESALIDLKFLGVDNILALRGDSMAHQKFFEPSKGGHNFATELVSQIKDLNSGKYLHGVIETNHNSDFCIGVGGYPEKHFESPSLQTDLKHLKEKVDAGADYIVTQMFFDNQKYFQFVEAAKKEGINVPIIPGLKPIAVKRHLQLLPQFFSIDLPESLISAVESCKTNKDVRQVGIEWAIQQSKELLDAGVPVLHYYSMGKSDNIKKIASAIF